MIMPQQQSIESLEDLQQRKEELKSEIQEGNDKISLLWHELVAPQKSNSKGELIASLVSNGVTAIDGFLLIRKLIKGYGFLFRRKKSRLYVMQPTFFRYIFSLSSYFLIPLAKQTTRDASFHGSVQNPFGILSPLKTNKQLCL